MSPECAEQSRCWTLVRSGGGSLIASFWHPRISGSGLRQDSLGLRPGSASITCLYNT